MQPRSALDRLDPQMRPIVANMLEQMESRMPFGQVAPQEMRARFDADMAPFNLHRPPLPRVEDFAVPTSLRAVPVRIYDPVIGTGPRPTLVYFHGGGWVVGNLESNDRGMRLLALQSGVSILSVDYCLAPENPFPAPLDECVEVLRWLREHARRIGVDPDRLAVGGDSAGANLALAAAIDLRDLGQDWLRFMLLICGVYSPVQETESHRLFGDGRYGFGSEMMLRLWRMYLGSEGDPADPRAAPLHAGLGRLPPAHVVAAGCDPLRDDSRHLASGLRREGARVELVEYPGVVHGFSSMTLELHVAWQASQAAAAALRRAIGTRAPGATG